MDEQKIKRDPMIDSQIYLIPNSQPDYGSVVQRQPNLQVSTSNWMPVPQRVLQNCPIGLQCLSTTNQLLVKQEAELPEFLFDIEANKKYTIKNNIGQKLFNAVEENNSCTKNCCGHLRSLEIKIFDNLNNEVIHLSRPIACQSCCFPCCLQKLQVFSPPGYLVGTIEQSWSIFSSMFTLRDATNEAVFKIKGPLCTCGTVRFKILSKDGKTIVGNIQKEWTELLKEAYTDNNNFNITFPLDLDVSMKTVMIGASFLIDFMYYEKK